MKLPIRGVALRIWQTICEMPKTETFTVASMCSLMGLPLSQEANVRVVVRNLEKSGDIHLFNVEAKDLGNIEKIYSRLPPAMHHKLPENIHPVTLYTLRMEGVTLGDNHGRL